MTQLRLCAQLRSAAALVLILAVKACISTKGSRIVSTPAFSSSTVFSWVCGDVDRADADLVDYVQHAVSATEARIRAALAEAMAAEKERATGRGTSKQDQKQEQPSESSGSRPHGFSSLLARVADLLST